MPQAYHAARVPTPEELHLKIARLYRRRDVFLRAAAKAQERIDALEDEVQGLRRPARSANVQPMTSDQTARRGRSRAKNLAKASKDPRRKAIAARWGSMRSAAAACGCSPAALVGYLDGLYPCPKVVAEAFAVDPKLPATGGKGGTWPKGVVS
jgi:hypothetical protein